MFTYLFVGRDYEIAKKNKALATWYSFVAGSLFIEGMGWFVVLSVAFGG